MGDTSPSHQSVVLEGTFLGVIKGDKAETRYDVWAADMHFKGTPTLTKR